MMSRCLSATLFFMVFFTGGVEAVELSSQQQSASGTHATALAHALKSKRSRLHASGTALRGIASDMNKLADDDDDEDDSENATQVSDKTLAASTMLYAGVKEESDKADRTYVGQVGVKEQSAENK